MYWWKPTAARRITIGRGMLSAWAALFATGCEEFGLKSWLGDGETARYVAGDPAGGSAGATTSANSTLPVEEVHSPQEPRVCVFDYDLTLSSHDCADTSGDPRYFCRNNTCDTYGWYPQCLAKAAREAIAECVRRHAYIGIASKANVDYCWQDKVLPIIEQSQFPELTSSAEVADAASPIRYPAIDDRSNWNCETCAYTMDGGLGKPEGIRRVMRHFGLDPKLASDRARVIFWDDTASNIDDVRSQMPEARAILVPSFTGYGVDGGCGITQAEIDAGWAP